jgi:hypothetical protein
LHERHLDHVDTDRVAYEVAHLAACDSRGDLDDCDPSVRSRDELGKRDAGPQPESPNGVDRNLLCATKLLAVRGWWVEMHPSDAEADARRPQPVREREQCGLSLPDDDNSVHLDPVDELFDDRSARRRLGERFAEIALEIVAVLDPEHRALPTGVGRLQHCRKAHRLEGSVDVVGRPHRGIRGLGHACVGKDIAHLELVRHPVGGRGADAREPECLCNRCDDRHGAVRGNCEHTVHLMLAADLGHARDIGEVDELADVGRTEAESVRVAVHCDDLIAELPRAQDGTALMSSTPDEEDGLQRVPSALPQVAGDPSCRYRTSASTVAAVVRR